MSLFSYEFFIFWIVTFALFYLIKGTRQWWVLLAASLYFYVRMSSSFPLILLLVSVTTYLGARYYESGHQKKNLIRLLVILNIGYLVLGRTTGLFAMLGNSYFTLKAIGYLIEVEREQTKVIRSYPRFLLYLIFFPTVLQGPFNRSGEFENYFTEHISPDMTTVLHGIQRFVWGAMKKLVLAERLAPFVDYVYNNLESTNGCTIVVATIAYAIQLYMDFSGCMDMMLGVAGTFGIKLPENFKRPYFAGNVADFWRRWHITLGHWFRDFVMFSFVMSPIGKKANKAWKKKWHGKGKLIVPIIGTMLVWICTGLWHGFGNNYLIWGCYYGVIISVSLLLEDWYARMRAKFHIQGKSAIYRLFCIIRTWCLVLFADIMIRCPDLGAMKTAFTKIFTQFGTGLCVDTTQYSWSGTLPFAAALCSVFAVSCMQEKEIDVLGLIDRQKLPVRWGIYYILLFTVFLFGIYGASYDTGQFLYGMF